jgi:hypothetical protein
MSTVIVNIKTSIDPSWIVDHLSGLHTSVDRLDLSRRLAFMNHLDRALGQHSRHERRKRKNCSFYHLNE